MKKLLLLLIITALIIPSSVIGQESDTKTAEEKIDEIKDKVTSRVEELDLVEKRGIVGVVESVDDDQIKLNDLNDKTRIIEVDEITKYSSADTFGFDIDSIEEGTKLSVIGLYNKDSEKLLARFVNEISIPMFVSGVISEINEDDFTVSISTEAEEEYLIDVENITRTFSFLDGDLESSGYSELELLQNAVIIGFADVGEADRISATRIIVFPNIPNNPNINVDIPEPTDEDSEGSSSSSPSPVDLEEDE